MLCCRQVPGEVVPSIAHLQDEGPEERPSLVDCLLFLRGSEEVCSRAASSHPCNSLWSYISTLTRSCCDIVMASTSVRKIWVA